MSPSFRAVLSGIHKSLTDNPERYHHTGLVLDKFVESSDRDDKDAQRTLIETACDLQKMTDYEQHLSRWREVLENSGAHVHAAHTLTPTVIGLGSESVIETGLAVHHTYGVPYLPGSALKGLASSYAHQHLQDEAWHKGQHAHKVLFGDTEEAGYVTFFDALPESYVLHPDVMTPHHPNYYMGNDPPADWDSPTPVSFVSFTGTFLVAVAGPEAWTNAAIEILDMALEDIGIGAKTSSGYGRLTMPTSPRQQQLSERVEEERASKAAQDALENLRKRFEALKGNRFASSIGDLANKLEELEVPLDAKRDLAQRMLEGVERKGNRNMKDKTWYRNLKNMA